MREKGASWAGTSLMSTSIFHLVKIILHCIIDPYTLGVSCVPEYFPLLQGKGDWIQIYTFYPHDVLFGYI